MPTVIPNFPMATAKLSEKSIITALEAIMDCPDWVPIHSLELAHYHDVQMARS